MDLDVWLPDPQVCVHHRREARVPADALWEAAETIRLRQTRTLGRVVRWRIPGTPADITYRDLFRRHPFCELDAGEHWSVSGLVGRIWTLDRDYPRLDGPEAFRDWDDGDSARVLFAHWVVDDGDGCSTLHSEVRLDPMGRRAGLRVRALWAVVGKFERFIGGEALRAAARQAERG
jgi:hypothetical protein